MVKSQPIATTRGRVWFVADGPPPAHWKKHPWEATELPVFLPPNFRLRQGKQKRSVRIFEVATASSPPANAAAPAHETPATSAVQHAAAGGGASLPPPAAAAAAAAVDGDQAGGSGGAGSTEKQELTERKLTDLKEALFMGYDIKAKQLFEHDGTGPHYDVYVMSDKDYANAGGPQSTDKEPVPGVTNTVTSSTAPAAHAHSGGATGSTVKRPSTVSVGGAGADGNGQGTAKAARLSATVAPPSAAAALRLNDLGAGGGGGVGSASGGGKNAAAAGGGASSSVAQQLQQQQQQQQRNGPGGSSSNVAQANGGSGGRGRSSARQAQAATAAAAVQETTPCVATRGACLPPLAGANSGVPVLPLSIVPLTPGSNNVAANGAAGAAGAGAASGAGAGVSGLGLACGTGPLVPIYAPARPSSAAEHNLPLPPAQFFASRSGGGGAAAAAASVAAAAEQATAVAAQYGHGGKSAAGAIAEELLASLPRYHRIQQGRAVVAAQAEAAVAGTAGGSGLAQPATELQGMMQQTTELQAMELEAAEIMRRGFLN